MCSSSGESRDQTEMKRWNCWEWRILELLSWIHNSIYITGFFQPNGICRNYLNTTNSKTCTGIHNFNIKLLTGQFGAKASKAYGKCLKSWKWQPIIHGESILAYLPKLEEDSILISFPSRLALVHSCNQLKVLHWRYCYPAMEIQAPTLQMLMPPWGFVPQNRTARRSRLQSIHLWIVKIFVIDCFLQHWALEWANHPSWTSWFQEVKFIRDLPNLKIACWNLRAYLLACKSPASSATWGLCTTVWWLAVIDCKVGT